MARLNLEDQFFIDVLSLVAQLGDQDRAIGQAVRLFRLAQEKHKHGHLITENEFKRNGFSDSLIGVFAERVDGGIAVVGAEKHFGWLAERVRAGRSGGKQTQANRGKRKQPQASPSPSPSPSCIPSLSKNNGQACGFDPFWEGYPRKVKKGKARDLYTKLIARGKDPAQILLAEERLKAHLKSEGTEKRYIPHPTTFLNSFEDYLAEDFGKTEDFGSGATSIDWSRYKNPNEENL